MIPRIQEERLIDAVRNNRVLLVSGPRKTGKTTLIETALSMAGFTYTSIDCTDRSLKGTILDSGKLDGVEEKAIILDEAQYLEDLQELIDRVLNFEISYRIIVCCSFVPSIHDELYEALKASGLEIKVYAPSFYEAADHFGLVEEEKLREDRLIYGNYPTVLTDLPMAEVTLREIILDVVETHLGVNDRINKKDKLMRMLQILAFEIGDTVSYHDIGERCGLDNETVERYIDLLVKADVLLRLPSFSNEHRYELKKSHCIYFIDNGIRNVLISNFNPTFLRNDMDQLWKNYLISERYKWIRMNGLEKELYFWKTHTKQFMDLVELGGEKGKAYKIDWEKRKKIKIPKYFTELYPEIKTSVLNKSTYWPFLTRKN